MNEHCERHVLVVTLYMSESDGPLIDAEILHPADECRHETSEYGYRCALDFLVEGLGVVEGILGYPEPRPKSLNIVKDGLDLRDVLTVPTNYLGDFGPILAELALAEGSDYAIPFGYELHASRDYWGEYDEDWHIWPLSKSIERRTLHAQ